MTILFADLVGSTALTDTLDPEEAKLVLGEALRRIIGVAESYGGYIKDVAGDGVLAFFGAPTAHEDDPERATRAGLDIVRSIAAYSRDVSEAWSAEGLAVRVGIHTGDVVVGTVGAGGRVEYGAVGHPVNVAARLQGAAEPGTVIVSEAAREFVVERFEWGPKRELQLKGKREVVIAYVANRIATLGAARPEGAPVTPLVGRLNELRVLEDLLATATPGPGAIVVITGEPGIGKSRMAAELRAMASHRGVDRWLEGRCVSYGDSLPYWPYRDLLRGWLNVGAQDPEVKVRVTLMRRLEELFLQRAEEIFPYIAGILGLRLDDESAARLAQVSPESIQYRTFEVVRDLVSRLGSDGPLVISIDDLHWADPTSLALTERLMALVETDPLLLVLTARPETEHASWQLKERAARDYPHLYRELALGPLGPESEAQLLDTLVGGRTLRAGTRRAILEHSAGNAFYLEEIIRSLGESGSSNGSGGAIGIPRTIEGVVLARIDRLEPDWREVLIAASVLGRSFTVELLCAVSAKDASSVRAALHHLLRLDLMQYDRGGDEVGYRFKHALIQETAYRTLVAGQRSLMHTRAAQWLESLYKDRPDRVYGLIAHHWRAANDLEKAARYLRLAGDRAMREWALDEAVDHFRALLPLLDPDEREATELLFQLASTLHLAMRHEEANEVWKEAFSRWRYSDPSDVEPTAIIRIATNQIPFSKDPTTGYYAANQTLFQQLWDRLVEGRPAPYVVPGLASKWHVSEDGLTYRFQLREGVTWNDGQPISSGDVVRAYRRVVEPGRLSSDATMLFMVENAEARSRGEVPAEAVGVRALDDRTVEIRLNRPYPAFLFYPLYPEFSAIRPDLASNGPFRLIAMDETRVVAERDGSYPRRRGGNVGRIEWILSHDPQALVEAARDDEIDAVLGHARLGVSPDQVGLVQVPTPRTQTGMIGFIGEGKFATGPEFRRALALAIDRDALAPAVPPYQDIARGGLVPPGLGGHTPDIALGFAPDEARRSLAASSHSGPIELAAAVEQRYVHIDLLARMWHEHLGLEVNVIEEPMARNQDWKTRCHVAYWTWVAHAPDPEYFLRNLLHGTSLTKLGGWQSPRLDALLDRAQQATDGALRRDLYHQADRLAVREECLVIPIVYGGIRWLVKPWVHGIWQWGSPWQSLDEVTIDESSPRFEVTHS